MTFRLRTFLPFALLLIINTLSAAEAAAGASDSEAEDAIKGFGTAEGLKVELFAAEPFVMHPVAICTDEKGRIYVAETHRIKDMTKPPEHRDRGALDMRSYLDFLDDDIACRSVEDRIKWYKTRLGDRAKDFEGTSEIVRRIEDRDGDGKADNATIFAQNFSKMEDGLAAGILAHKGNVWLTDIPNLWLLRDENDDGKSDKQQILHTGFGVRVAYLGHDMHGLILGPDGRLYFSIGDRGLNVKTTDGRHLYNPDSGAVMRCFPDGSELELVATGMRNPQELAFDNFGNLFAGDNNSDKGDPCRWVWALEGGDSGWRIGYQHINPPFALSPFHADRYWSTPFDGQAAFVLPPLGYVTIAGPSGLAHYPGTGLAERYNDHFFICDYRGVKGVIISFGLKPKGSAWEVIDQQDFFSNGQVTDVMFGIDGKVYTSLWYGPIAETNKGRIYTVSDPEAIKDPIVGEVKKLFNDGFDHRSAPDLAKLLAHKDQRIRLEAQWALAEKGAASEFTNVLNTSGNLLARVHAIWGLGQIAHAKKDAAVLDPLLAVLNDGENEVRGQAVKVLGDEHVAKAYDGVLNVLKTGSPRLKLLAAMSLGKIGDARALDSIATLLRENNNKDPYLRHAGIMALFWICQKDEGKLLTLASDASPAVRVAVLLALRRMQSAEVARFLKDSETSLVLEAARAINDVPIPAAYPQLADLLQSDLWKKFSVGEVFALERLEPKKNDADTKKVDSTIASPSTALHGSDEKKKEEKKEDLGLAIERVGAKLITKIDTYSAKEVDDKNIRISGHLPILMGGPYVFSVSGSDIAEMWLSTDDKPENKRLIAQTRGRTNPQTWNSFAEQQSYPMMLSAGKRYYFEAILKKSHHSEFTTTTNRQPAAARSPSSTKPAILGREATESFSIPSAGERSSSSSAAKSDGPEHLSVGWELPNRRAQRPIANVSNDDQNALIRRAMNANFRVGSSANAKALVAAAMKMEFTPAQRAEALILLSGWGKPPGRDAVVNLYYPLPERDAGVAAAAFEPIASTVLNDPEEGIQASAAIAAGKLQIKSVSPLLLEIATAESRAVSVRIEAMKALAELKEQKLLDAIKTALASSHGDLRMEALTIVGTFDPVVALPLLEATLGRPNIPEKQTALQVLAKMKLPAADALISKSMDSLLAGKVEPEVQLDVIDAALASSDAVLKSLVDRYKAALPKEDEVAPFKVALVGGASANGRKVFFESAAAQCIRCHKINGTGGDVGPELKNVGTKGRDYILESIVSPSAKIAEGYETISFKLNDGRVVMGTVKKEDDTDVSVACADGTVSKLKKADIKLRRGQKISTMPPMGDVLTKREIRDLVEFLSGMK